MEKRTEIETGAGTDIFTCDCEDGYAPYMNSDYNPITL